VPVGVHFWLALIGLGIYATALMVGGTLRGMAWMQGSPFIDSVSLMAPYWTARALGGGLMFGSHLVFAYNVWRMRP
jgi:cytochrome c oxidase cbb3-type subunit 1